MTSHNANFDDPQPRACLRGRTYRRWLASPDRLSYRMKRVGARGEGKFERISWEEVIETACSKLKEVIDKYGNEAVYVPYATGVSATTARPFNRLFNLLGGYLNFYNSYSTAQISCITPYMYGSKNNGSSSFNEAENAKLVLIFGSSPTETRQGGLTTHYDWVHLRERTGAKIYMIDPRMNDSIQGHSDQWLPINPGTDAALVAGIALIAVAVIGAALAALDLIGMVVTVGGMTNGTTTGAALTSGVTMFVACTVVAILAAAVLAAIQKRTVALPAIATVLAIFGVFVGRLVFYALQMSVGISMI